jgi:mycofactocin precursor
MADSLTAEPTDETVVTAPAGDPADSLTAEPTDETVVTAPAGDLADGVLADDVLVEEVSIDGMCGVY